MNIQEEIVLGYLDSIETFQDEIPSFACGSPIFLEDTPIIKCKLCGEIMKFLLQLYAPVGKIDNRVLYVFICFGVKCIGKLQSFRVIRQQAKQLNEISKSGLKEYILADQSMSISTEIVSREETKNQLEYARQLLPVEDDFDDDENVKADFRKQDQILQEYITNCKGQSGQDALDELNDYEKNTKNNADSAFLIYQHFVQYFTNHVIRYCFHPHSEPLWFADNGKECPKLKCQRCGKQKQFEFQINNSILGFFKELYNSEWGILCVYSCPDSCAGPSIDEDIIPQFDDHEPLVDNASVDSKDLQVIQEQPKPKNKSKKNKPKQQQPEADQADNDDSDGSDDW